MKHSGKIGCNRVVLVLSLMVSATMAGPLASPALSKTWNIETVDSVGGVGTETYLALDSSGDPHISYLGGGGLKYAAWDGSAWSIEMVDANVQYTSLALDSSGKPHISYRDGANCNLKYAAWDGSAWNIETIDSGGSVGEYTSLALDSSGNPHISYYDSYKGDLKYAYIPEPASASLLLLGAVAMLRRRRRP